MEEWGRPEGTAQSNSVHSLRRWDHTILVKGGMPLPRAAGPRLLSPFLSVRLPLGMALRGKNDEDQGHDLPPDPPRLQPVWPGGVPTAGGARRSPLGSLQVSQTEAGLCTAQTHGWMNPIGYYFYRHSFIMVLIVIKEKKVLRGTQPPKPPGTAPDPNDAGLAAGIPSSSAR